MMKWFQSRRIRSLGCRGIQARATGSPPPPWSKLETIVIWRHYHHRKSSTRVVSHRNSEQQVKARERERSTCQKLLLWEVREWSSWNACGVLSWHLLGLYAPPFTSVCLGQVPEPLRTSNPLTCKVTVIASTYSIFSTVPSSCWYFTCLLYYSFNPILQKR